LNLNDKAEEHNTRIKSIRKESLDESPKMKKKNFYERRMEKLSSKNTYK